MKCTAEQILNEALAAWDWNGQVAGALRYGAGHINDTFCVYVQDEAGDCVRYILQRINTNTFTDPEGLMENICGVTGYLRKVIEEQGGDPMRETMNVVPTREGKAWYADSDGGAWRVYTFVEGTVCLQKVENERDFYTAAAPAAGTAAGPACPIVTRVYQPCAAAPAHATVATLDRGAGEKIRGRAGRRGPRGEASPPNSARGRVRTGGPAGNTRRTVCT